MSESIEEGVVPSLAVPTGSPLLIENPQSDPYPFERLRGREAEMVELRRWLLGTAGSTYAPDQLPLGGAALLTGFRGVGKTSVVNKTLFDVAIMGLYGLPYRPGGDGARFGPFDRDQLSGLVKRTTSAVRNPRLYLPIHVDIANPIDHLSLMHRVIRRTYFTLARHGIADVRPDLMRRARHAYIRTLGELSTDVARTVRSRVESKAGISLEGMATLDVTAEQELEFAETLKLTSEMISIEEAEDELIDLGSELSGSHLGAKSSWFKRASSGVSSMWNTARRQLREIFQGAAGQQVHLVYVFDELDKLDTMVESQPAPIGSIAISGEQSVPSRNVPFATEMHQFAARGTFVRQAGAAGADRLRSAVDVIAQLKVLFTARGVSAIVVGGTSLEQAWLDERAEIDPVLRSVFTRHVYVPLMDLASIKDQLEGCTVAALTDDQLARATAFWTTGRYKHVLRFVDQLGHRDPDRLARMARLIGSWKSPPVPGTGTILEQIKRAADLEQLAHVVAATVPLRQDSKFGPDVIRAVLVAVCVRLMDATDLVAEVEDAKSLLSQYMSKDVAAAVAEHISAL